MDTNPDLESFREQWRAEVRARNSGASGPQQQSTTTSHAESSRSSAPKYSRTAHLSSGKPRVQDTDEDYVEARTFEVPEPAHEVKQGDQGNKEPVTALEKSLNFFKGYGKVNPLEDQSPHQQESTASKRRILFISVSSILFFTLILGLALAALIHESNTEPDEFPYLSASNSSESIKTVCDMTLYPSSCFTSISSLNISTKPDPEAIFKLSLKVSITELKCLSSLFTSSHDVNSQAAMRDCVSLFDNSLGKLNDSLLAMEVGPGEKMLTLEKVNDIQTWIGAAMTDQETCIDGLEEMESVLPDEIKAKVERSKDFLSISLAIIAKMGALLKKFDLEMH